MSTNAAQIAQSACVLGDIEKPVPIGSETYNRVVEFLYREAWLLDHDRFEEWLATLAQDLIYIAPVQVTRSRDSGGRSLTGRTNYHYYDDYKVMAARIRRLVNTTSAWSDDPPIRIRRVIANVMVAETEADNELHVRSYLQLARNRFEAPNHQWITAERNDILRREGDSFLVARREILLDTAVLGTPNLAFFL
jgi:3-phenylpropionate/cinnamic acid dioxygenase small subunit